MRVLAFDTSNYTTSVASFDGTEGHNISRLLDVEQGRPGRGGVAALLVAEV